jgi:hypothetical protein
MTVKEVGNLLGYGNVYYHPQVTANVISFFNIAKMFKSITHVNKEWDAFLAMRNDDSVIEFAPSSEGLYYYDFKKSIERQRETLHKAMVIKSVEELKGIIPGESCKEQIELKGCM